VRKTLKRAGMAQDRVGIRVVVVVIMTVGDVVTIDRGGVGGGRYNATEVGAAATRIKDSTPVGRAFDK